LSCFSCTQNERADLPLRERIGEDDHWRVAHVTETAVPGWLVLVPRRHVIAIAQLTDAEAASLGAWQVRLSRALHEVTGCAKTYVVQFAEADGFAHVHFHAIPRATDLPADVRGPRIFGLLNPGPDRAIPTDLMDEVASALAARLHCV
jgi:diadenosine tetraphosphate (Ap4A) HIT family hydrolase